MATIIRASGPLRTIDGMSFNFDDMSVKAGEYLDKIQAQAAEIIANAEREGEAIRRKAEEDGKQAAIRAVEKVMSEKVGKQLATLTPALKQAANEIIEAKQAWLLHWEKTAVNVATQIAERVIRRELSRDPQITVTLIKEALELASGSAEMQVQLHPDDAAALGNHVETLRRELSRCGQATIVADPTIEPGGCRVQTKFGVVDQQITSQLKRIEEELT